MMKIALAALAFLALPAAAADGFFAPKDAGEPKVLRVLQCAAGQSMTCRVHCPAPPNGRLPAATACVVVSCSCDDTKLEKGDALADPSAALVSFNLRETLGLAIPK